MHGTCKLLYSTEIGAEMAEKFVKMGSVPVKLRIKMLEMGQDFSVEFSFGERLQGTD